jgi:hypothetical protein
MSTVRPTDLPAEGSDDAPLAMGEPVGGLLAMEAGDDLLGDELALGDADDYGDFSIALGEADDEGASVALTFGVSDTLAGDGQWDLGDVKELVVQETKGDFGGDGTSARDDAMVMEAAYDPEAEFFDAVWQDPGGKVRVGRAIRRSHTVDPVLLPYGVIAGGLLLLGGAAAVVVVGLVIAAVLMPGPEPIETRVKVPDVQIDEAAIEEAKKKTADQILQEVLGDDAEPGAPEE